MCHTKTFAKKKSSHATQRWPHNFRTSCRCPQATTSLKSLPLRSDSREHTSPDPSVCTHRSIPSTLGTSRDQSNLPATESNPTSSPSSAWLRTAHSNVFKTRTNSRVLLGMVTQSPLRSAHSHPVCSSWSPLCRPFLFLLALFRTCSAASYWDFEPVPTFFLTPSWTISCNQLNEGPLFSVLSSFCILSPLVAPRAVVVFPAVKFLFLFANADLRPKA